jgi:hypothetical protein
MRIKRSVLESIVREELITHIHALMEADNAEKDVDVVDAQSNKKKIKPQMQPDNIDPGAEKKNAKPLAKKPVELPVKKSTEPPTKKTKEPSQDEVPTPEEPADDELAKDVAGEDEEDAKGGSTKLNDELSGKTVQSITMEPKSKMMPGAIEIVLTFDQTPDPFKILVGKSGKVVFYYRGLHNTL